MKFALLGTDAESRLLAQTAKDLGHECIWCGDAANADRAAHPWLTDEDQADQWEVLCDRGFCDFVIVGRGGAPTDRRMEQLIQIVKNEVPTITTFPLTESVLSYYEVDMARCESGGILYHFNPLLSEMNHLKELRSWIADGHPELGRIEQLICDRPIKNRSRDCVLWHFARDVELLDRVAGPLDRLGAVGSPNEAATYSGLSVQLLGNTQVPVRWSVGPVDQSNLPSLTFVGEHGRQRLGFDEACSSPTETGVPDKAASTTAAAVTMKKFLLELAESHGSRTTWPEALRAMELTDTIEISLRRGRMIDVHRQQLTEELSFRGTMSAVGCGVLLLLPPLLILAGWLAEVLGLGIPRFWWAYLLLTLMGFFLLVQVAPKLFLKNRE